MKTVFLFPGQGAQYPGMAKDLYDRSAQVRDLFAQASEVAGKNMADLLFAGSEDDLKSTDNTQIAMTLANMAAATVLKEAGHAAELCAGFSIGEYAALWEAGVLAAPDVFKAVLARGEVMEKASRLLDSPAGNPGMSAILGLTIDEIRPVLAETGTGKVFVANHNSPSQVVIAGTMEGLEAAEAALDKAGAMKIVRLKVSGPFHSPLLSAASQQFAEKTSSLVWKDPVKPIISNVTAEPIKSGSEARELAARQIVSMVRWVDTMGVMKAAGASLILEVGPGKVLTGLWRAFSKEPKCQPAGTAEAIAAIQA